MTATRRTLLATATCAFLLCTSTSAAEPPRADAARLESRIKALGQFGANPEGGVSRVAFSDADIAGREYIASLMRAAGLTVRVDAAGNLIGRREG
ncbi:MAG: Zn-dependent hydrolase, partial [Gammaproteobacteria bacterium]|nr:Zn-dependent hydrolase [Gammaproteobacteria bacterium]